MSRNVGKCPACGSSDSRPLTRIGPPSLLSDGRLMEQSLDWAMCMICGLGFRRAIPDASQIRAVFEDNYSLYAHAPNHSAEQQRQSLYAEWIVELLGETPVTLFEAGCGNGSLLLELRKRLPETRFSGVEPADAAARWARSAGFDVTTGFLQDHLTLARTAETRLAVNVIEHVIQPADFLRQLASGLLSTGRLVIVCPDGSRPADDLLMADHLFAITPQALHHLAAHSDLSVERIVPAPPDLGSFHAAVLRCPPHQKPVPIQGADLKRSGRGLDTEALATARKVFLASWAALDAALLGWVDEAGADDISCFGAGETADLLRAYAPRFWSLVRRCVVDGQPIQETHWDVPVEEVVAERLAGPGKLTVIATKEGVQAAIFRRLADQGIAVLPLANAFGELRGRDT